MSSTRQSDRPDPARRRPLLTPEPLESRQLLSTGIPNYLSVYTPSDLYVTNPITHQRIPTSVRSQMQHNNPNSPLLSNQGKIVSGMTRDGTQWTITVHGPGQVIVTDTTPNDGALDDDLATIQIINSSPRTTYVTGTTVASNQVLSDGTVNFNRLIALGGVKSIDLHGFNLSADVTPAVTQSPGIFLYGGVGTLRFHDINAVIDTASYSTQTGTTSSSSSVSSINQTVNPAPAFTSAGVAAFNVGQAGSFTITTTGSPAAAITETGSLPSGVTLTDNGDGTATLAGTPQEGTAGTYSLNLTAANGISPNATQSFTLTVNPQYQIIIGRPTTPLTVKPSIYLDSVINSVFDSSATTVPTAPITTPSVIFSVNGVVQNFSVVSITQSPVPPNYLASSKGGTVQNWTGVPQSFPIPAGYQFLFNVVGTTGRTTLQVLAVNHLNVVGKATNFTAQRDTTPFGTSLSGMKYIRRATFGGNADAVALDVKGTVGKVTFKRGLGDPTGVFNGKVTVPNTSSAGTPLTQLVPATNYGVPLGSEGYPAHGLLGGVIRAQSISKLKVGPANYITQTAQNPNFVQLNQDRSPTYYLVNPGTAVTNAAITTDGSIGKVQITGNQLNSEIKTGFNYASYLAGLQGTGSPSQIRRVRQRGDLVSSVNSATVRPTVDSTTSNTVYSTSTNVNGPGSITGTATLAIGHGRYAASYSKLHYPGSAYNTGGRTALGNYGAGFFARRVSRKLPHA